MTKEEKSRYSEPEALRDILKRVLSGRKFLLDCGHHVSFGTNLGNDITVINGKEPKIICSLCGHYKEDSMCDHDGPDWKDIALAGALAEEIAEALERM